MDSYKNPTINNVKKKILFYGSLNLKYVKITLGIIKKKKKKKHI